MVRVDSFVPRFETLGEEGYVPHARPSAVGVMTACEWEWMTESRCEYVTEGKVLGWAQRLIISDDFGETVVDGRSRE